MITRLAPSLLSLLLAGCIGYVHDDKIEGLKPAPVELARFAGVYADKAVYHTKPNAIGLMGHTTLGSALRGVRFDADVTIEITPAGDIVVSAPATRFPAAIIRYGHDKDFEFVDHRVVFHRESHAGSHDSPVMGAYTREMQWMLDDGDRLVVVSGSKGAGLIGIMPAAVGGSILAIFERVKRPTTGRSQRKRPSRLRAARESRMNRSNRESGFASLP